MDEEERWELAGEVFEVAKREFEKYGMKLPQKDIDVLGDCLACLYMFGLGIRMRKGKGAPMASLSSIRPSVSQGVRCDNHLHYVCRPFQYLVDLRVPQQPFNGVFGRISVRTEYPQGTVRHP